MKLYCICWITFLMLIFISPLISQNDDLNNNNFEKRNINKDSINKKYRPRLSLGIGSPELFNVGLAMKLNDFQIGGIYGGYKTIGSTLLFDYRIIGVECTFIYSQNNGVSRINPPILRFNYYHRTNTFLSGRDFEKYISILGGKEMKNFHIHYGLLFRIKGRREHFKPNSPSNEEYDGWGPPIWPSVGIRYIIQ